MSIFSKKLLAPERVHNETFRAHRARRRLANATLKAYLRRGTKLWESNQGPYIYYKHGMIGTLRNKPMSRGRLHRYD